LIPPVPFDPPELCDPPPEPFDPPEALLPPCPASDSVIGVPQAANDVSKPAQQRTRRRSDRESTLMLPVVGERPACQEMFHFS
jgi:hypothetical protein